jgi:hypothetical protein
LTSRSIPYRIADAVFEVRRRVRSEENFVRAALGKWCRPGQAALDIGCGWARFHETVCERGLRYIGVDVNPMIVRTNRENGLDVRMPEELRATGVRVDCLIASHVIEHLPWMEAASFLEHYSQYLRVGGVLIILTPLMCREFYDDFDHVKPYNPEAVRTMLCKERAQAQPTGISAKYEEVGLWMKRDPLWHSHGKGTLSKVMSVAMTAGFVATAGVIGRANGYGMVLKRRA